MIFGIFHLGGKFIKEKLAEISAQATVEQWNKEIAAMPVWDGVERQIREHNQFYGISQDWYKVGVRFGGDPNKWRNISLIDVQHNREFWSSGLTPANFAKEYFLKRYQENPHWNDHYIEDVFRCLYGLFSGEIKARSIIRDQVKKLPIDKIASYTACLKTNLEPVSITLKAKDEAKNFRNAYARVRYILAIPNRYVAW